MQDIVVYFTVTEPSAATLLDKPAGKTQYYYNHQKELLASYYFLKFTIVSYVDYLPGNDRNKNVFLHSLFYKYIQKSNLA